MVVKHFNHIVLSLGALFVVGITYGTAALMPRQVGPSYLYPNSALTPGLVATQDVNLLTATNPTYSQAHRNTTEVQKNAVCKEYPKGCAVPHEIDHFCPLALGCADDVKNLWAQPEVNTWNGVDYGFHAKDKLESYLVLQMKAGNITPKAAQECVLTDWVACYQHYFKPSFGNTVVNTPAIDPDDE